MLCALQRRVETLHYTSLRCRMINHMHFPILTTPNHCALDNLPLRGVGCAPPCDASYHACFRHVSLRRPVGNTPLPEGEPCMYTYNCHFFLRTHLFVLTPSSLSGTLRGGGHNSTVEVTLPEVWARSVQCVARGEHFKHVWLWAWIRQISGVPQHPASCARTKGIHFSCNIPFARAPNAEVTFTFDLFCPLMNTTMSTANTQRAQQR